MATKEEIREALAELLGLGGNDDKETENQPTPPAPKQKTDEELLAEEQARLEALQAKQSEGREKDETKRQLEETQRQIKAYQDKEVESTLTTKLVEKGFDSETLKDIFSYFKYDKLRNDKGELDEEKVNEFTGAIANVSLKNPPKGNLGNSTNSGPNKNGIGKYLDKK